MKVSEESSSDSEGFDTACEEEGEIEETKKLECNCEKCCERESYCCSQFLKVKKECQEKGPYCVYLSLGIIIYLGVRCVTEIPRFIKMMDKVYKIHTFPFKCLLCI